MKHQGYLYIDVAAGARKQEWTGLLAGVEFRDCGDHMFWTRKIQTWMCSRSVEE